MITTLTGENDFLRSRELNLFVDNFVAQNGDFALERIDGEEMEFAKVSEALTSLPFLASYKLVVFKNPSGNKEFMDKYETLLKNLPETTYLILVEAKMDKRTSLYKYLKKSSDFKEFSNLDSNKLANWLVDAAKAGGGAISPGDARYLIVRAGENQQKLSNELAKLLANNPKITKEAIDQLVAATPQTKIFDLLDAAFNSDKKRMLKIYTEQRQLGEEPQKIIGLLAWQLHLLALVKAAGGKTPSEIASQAKVSPYSVGNARKLAAKLSLGEIKRNIRELLELDRKSKSTNLNLDEALETYLLGL